MSHVERTEVLASSAAYTERVHELLWSECYTNHEINEDHCATVDTGCQRTAVGSDTLARLLARQPEGLSACYKGEVHCFKSVNGVTRTNRVACVPTSLGKKGCILRPAVFEDGQSKTAPFLLSLPFLLHCQATMCLDPSKGLKLLRYHFTSDQPVL